MKRREFLRHLLPATTLPWLLGGFPLRVYAGSPLLDLLTSDTGGRRVLVLLQLNGGNDGLNTVIPLDQYDRLTAARSNILMDSASVLKLVDNAGLHPAMQGMAELYHKGLLTVIQGVGYPNPDFSHFRSTDIWLTASDSSQLLSSGWLGRYLDRKYPGYPAGYPSADVPDPPGIQVGPFVSPAFDGPATGMGIAVTDPATSYSSTGGGATPADTPAGQQLAYIRDVAQKAEAYTSVIKQADAKARNLSPLYPDPGLNALADQLRIVARLIAGGLGTRIYVVNLGGFDTHSAQVDSSNPAAGVHAQLLGKLSAAITAFQDDLRLLGLQDRVLGLTFSEFGRRIKSNLSHGTDHGTAAPLFVFGSAVAGGIVGESPALPPSATVNDNLAMQYDFRSVYATVLRDWFGAPAADLEAALMRAFDTLPVLSPSAVLAVKQEAPAPARFLLEQNYPNPFNPSTTIEYETAEEGSVRVAVYDVMGREVALLSDGRQSPGRYRLRFDGSRLASGVYFCKLDAGSRTQTRRMVLTR